MGCKNPEDYIYINDYSNLDWSESNELNLYLSLKRLGNKFSDKNIIKNKNMKFDFGLTNPPYKKRAWKNHVENLSNLVTKGFASINPNPLDSDSDFSNDFKNFLIKNGVQHEEDITDSFTKLGINSGKISYFICDKNKEYNKNVIDKNVSFHVKLKKITDLYPKCIVGRGPLFAGDSTKGSSYKLEISNEKNTEYIEPVILSSLKDSMEIVYSKENDKIKRWKLANIHNGRYLILNRYFGKNNPDPIYLVDDFENYIPSYAILYFKLNDDETLDSFKSVYCSEIYREMLSVMRGGKMDTLQSHIEKLPRLPLNKIYTESEIKDIIGNIK